MRIGCDLDGCAYPFAEEFTQYVSYRLGVQLPPFTHWNSHQKHWGLSHEQLSELMADALQDGRLWSRAAPVRGFADATWKLIEMGHTVVIATDRLQDTPYAKLARQVTRQWLLNVHANYDELIFTADKRDARADIFIDDRPQAIPTLRLDGVTAIYFSRPWNLQFPYPRVDTWDEFVKFVEEQSSVQTG